VTDTAIRELMEWDDTSQYMDPLSLEDSRRHHRWVLRAMYEAKKDLEAMRNAEIVVESAYLKAKRKAILSKECPRVARDGATAAERDAWVELETAELELQWKRAKAATADAKEHIDTLRSQSYSIGSLAKLVQKLHDVAGAP
jgi:hypothetical protein